MSVSMKGWWRLALNRIIENVASQDVFLRIRLEGALAHNRLCVLFPPLGESRPRTTQHHSNKESLRKGSEGYYCGDIASTSLDCLCPRKRTIVFSRT